jgi:predicted nucleic acid-binding protein
VADASVLVDVLVGEGRAATHLAESWVAVPHLVDAEVGHVIRRHVHRGRLSADRGGEALADLAALELLRYDHVGLLARGWELRDNLSFYDGLYVALAEWLDAPLLTHDARLAGAPGVLATVHVLPVG